MLSRLFCKYRQALLVIAGSALLVSCDRLITPDFNTSVAELRGGQYTLDKEHATLLWKIDHLGFSRYIGRFNDFDATLDFDPENVENSSLEVIIDTATLDVNNEAFAEDLRGGDWFDVETFPQAVFRTTSFVEAVDEDTFIFEGDLTLLGTTGPVTMTVNFNGGGRNFLTRRYTLGFSATAEFLRSDFGLDNMVAFGVGDDIQVEVHVEFQDASQ
ncbi:MAG: YceI family protein [Pseudohongiella sp.]|uniref:YceI family protein n=1 Tax=Pseudohongiella sp. TaxID=1979412 RepID=UPI00349FD94C